MLCCTLITLRPHLRGCTALLLQLSTGCFCRLNTSARTAKSTSTYRLCGLLLLHNLALTCNILHSLLNCGIFIRAHILSNRRWIKLLCATGKTGYTCLRCAHAHTSGGLRLTDSGLSSGGRGPCCAKNLPTGLARDTTSALNSLLGLLTRSARRSESSGCGLTKLRSKARNISPQSRACLTRNLSRLLRGGTHTRLTHTNLTRN